MTSIDETLEQGIQLTEEILTGETLDTLTGQLKCLPSFTAKEDWLKRHLTGLFAASYNLHKQKPDMTMTRSIHDFLPPFSGCVGSVMIGQNERVNGEAMGTITNFLLLPDGDAQGAIAPVKQAVVNSFVNGLRSRGSTFFKTNHFQSLPVLEFMCTICHTTPPVILPEDSIEVFTSMIEQFRRRIPMLFGDTAKKERFMRIVQRQADENYAGNTRPILRSIASSSQRYERAYQSGAKAIEELRGLTRRE